MGQGEFRRPLRQMDVQLQDAMWFRRFDFKGKSCEAIAGALLYERCHFGRVLHFYFLEIVTAGEITQGWVLEAATGRRSKVGLEKFEVAIPVGAVICR